MTANLARAIPALRSFRTATPSLASSWVFRGVSSSSKLKGSDEDPSSPPTTASPHSSATLDDTSSTPLAASDKSTAIPVKKLSQAEKDAEAFRRFEEKFGGQSQTQLGVLVDGKPEGLARSVKKNMFRLI